jgi:hypothetical protein
VQTIKSKCLILFLTLSQIASAETLLEKTRNGRDLTAVDLTSIFLAEVKACEDNVPEFKEQANSGFGKLKSREQFRKIISLIDTKQYAEATAVVAARGIPSKAQCNLTLQSIQFELSRLK